MIDHEQLREHVIRPVLKHLSLYSLAAENLLILTVAQESLGGRYLKQLGRGPAVGIYQMEPDTHNDIWDNWLRFKPSLSERVVQLELPEFLGQGGAYEMAGNLYYATAMARCHYWRVPDALPDADDVDGMAAYWKQHYNTHMGAGTVAEAKMNFSRYVGRTAVA